MVKINRSMVSAQLIKSRTSGAGNTMKGITIHETANTNVRANADAHARLQLNGNSRDASWHYQVDDKEIIQSFEDNIKCWHAGGTANATTISIEICVNSDGNYKKAVENAAKLTKHLMNKYNISISNVRQHNYYTGKNCPNYLRNNTKGINWSQFISLIQSNGSSISTSSPGQKSPSEVAREVYLGRWGNGQERINKLRAAGYDPVIIQSEVDKLTGKTKPQSTNKLKVDGYMGPETIKAMQRYFGTPVDGVISKPSMMIRQLQKMLGVNQDGHFGPITIRALQERMGTPVDGAISKPSMMVKKLQERLNRGSL